MLKRNLSQEGLKAIACVTMLLDHIGAVIVLNCFYQATGAAKGTWLEIYETLRTIGRLAFPIFCFLLVEGVFYTRNPKKYGLRLLIGAILSEIPYDLAFYGSINWQSQSVMVTLLMGFLMLETMKRMPKLLLKLLLVLPFAFLAERFGTDYGDMGIMVIATFALTRNLKRKHLWQFFLLWFIFSPNHLMMLNWMGGIQWTMQELAAFAVVPIALYSGRKATKSRALQWGFYLFYPVHLLILYLI